MSATIITRQETETEKKQQTNLFDLKIDLKVRVHTRLLHIKRHFSDFIFIYMKRNGQRQRPKNCNAMEREMKEKRITQMEERRKVFTNIITCLI